MSPSPLTAALPPLCAALWFCGEMLNHKALGQEASTNIASERVVGCLVIKFVLPGLCHALKMYSISVCVVVHLHVCGYVCVGEREQERNLCMHVCAQDYWHTNASLCVKVCVGMRVCTCLCTHAFMSVNVYVCVYSIYVHEYVHVCPCLLFFRRVLRLFGVSWGGGLTLLQGRHLVLTPLLFSLYMQYLGFVISCHGLAFNFHARLIYRRKPRSNLRSPNLLSACSGNENLPLSSPATLHSSEVLVLSGLGNCYSLPVSLPACSIKPLPLVQNAAKFFFPIMPK